jgi:outer membrane protein TolC
MRKNAASLGSGRRRLMGAVVVVGLIAGSIFSIQSHAAAQTEPTAILRITFDEAILRATTNHPTVHHAAAGVLRADAILQQVRARSWPAIDASLSTNIIDPVTRFSGSAISPRTQTVTTGGLSVPLVTPVLWAQRNQASDQTGVSQRAFSEARRAAAVAAADAYLTVIAQRRVLDLNERARDNARAHYEFANQRYEGGIGSRLNALRAQQELSSSEARVEDARLTIARAQEALGVLVAVNGPVDAADTPVFDAPPDGEATAATLAQRSDIRLVIERQRAAERVAADTWKDNLPSVTALFTPQMLAPAGLFAEARSWRASVLFTVPIFDSGQRSGLARERRTLVEMVRTERANLERQALADVRTARAAILANERALAHAERAAAQANDVVRITDIAFREGATTNIEVIDAQRRARDAETAAVIAEDAVRRARLELLVATGQFPQ